MKRSLRPVDVWPSAPKCSETALDALVQSAFTLRNKSKVSSMTELTSGLN